MKQSEQSKRSERSDQHGRLTSQLASSGSDKKSQSDKTLATSGLNQPQRITDLKGDSVLVSRLREIGFVRGEEVQVRGRALFGEPILVEIRGAVVALRKVEAKCVKL